MFAISKRAAATLAVGAAFALPAAAEMSAADIAKLGTTLTPVGAEKAGNAAGTIPAWDGGITRPVAGYKPGGQYPDPFPSDKPLFTIDGKSADKYRDQLTPGQVAMLKKYPDYKMIVYPTRRSASFPQCHYNETKECAAKAKLAAGGTASPAAWAASPSRSRRTASRRSGTRCCATAATPSRRTGPRPR